MPFLIIFDMLQNILFLLYLGVQCFVVFGMNLTNVILNIFDRSYFHRPFMLLEFLEKTQIINAHFLADFCNLQKPISVIIVDAVHGLLLALFVSWLGFGPVDGAVH